MAVVALSLPLATFAQEAAKPAEPPKPAITPYGFVLLNTFWNTGTFAAKDYPAQAQVAQTGGAFLMSARQSRFGVKLAMNDDNWTGAALTGTIEFDFKAGHLPANPTATSTSGTTCTDDGDPATPPVCTTTTTTTVNAQTAASTSWNAGLMRLRLASATATWKTSYGSWAVLAGQDYGLVNPLFATSVAWVADPIFWQAGNYWRRSPQIRATYSNTFGMAGISLAGAILSPADGTANALDFGAGSRARSPHLEARLGANLKLAEGMTANLGVGYHSNKRRLDGPTAGTTVDVTGSLIGVDADINVPYLNVRGEWFDGKAVDDTYNGIITNGTRGSAGNYEKIGSQGFWAQAVIKPIDKVWVTVGFGQTKLSNLPAADAASAQRSKNQQVEGGIIVNAGKYWKVGLEVEQTTTTFNRPTNNEFDAMQVALSSMLSF